MSETNDKALLQDEAVRSAITKHSRLWEENYYVYPVLSRRSKGISIGINLNPDKICNFDCIYCQVDRKVEPVIRTVDLDRLEEELHQLLAWVDDGTLFQRPPFTDIPDHLKRVNDIAFSGDGEPTSYTKFYEVVEKTVAVRDRFNLQDVKLNVITNCTLFHRPNVQRTLEYLDKHNGEIWAKLDAGTDSYYKTVERTRIPFDRIVQNIHEAARLRALVIQSLFMVIHDEPPPAGEIDAYCGILNSVLNSGGKIKLIQLYTVARNPAESYVKSLSNQAMDDLGAYVKHKVLAPVEVYYGVGG